MNSDTFDTAVSTAREELDSIRSFLKGDFNIDESRTVNIKPGMLHGVDLALNISLIRSSSKKLSISSIRKTLSQLNQLVVDARNDQPAFDQLSMTAKVCLERRIGLPAILRQWVAGVLTGEVERPATPKAKRRAKAYPKLYDLFVAHTVVQISQGFSVPIISENSPNWSACDVVAKALLELKLKPTSALEVYKLLNRTGPLPFVAPLSYEGLGLPVEVDDPFSA